ncbi:MAG: L-2-amino-thiazoline-4-carboxylic acid hydrolase [Synergistaceae bacterium]|jgi:hypothetical protein|nr:L-2-amino-thiazoline-4-carboxylic acid hydrolase [Synergistaceae bacterium]
MITNKLGCVDDSKIEDLRAAFEHRATWFFLLIDEARKKGLDLSFAHDAIFRCGCFHGDNKFPRTNDLKIFAKAFANDNAVKIFEMDVQESTESKFYAEFHYCPLVNAWQTLGASEEFIGDLCDIAMDGDRGIISRYEDFEFHLGGVIAKGNEVCQVTIRKKAR